ncbi:unnamed protein product, partial [Dicrocoelium dendriticum]
MSYSPRHVTQYSPTWYTTDELVQLIRFPLSSIPLHTGRHRLPTYRQDGSLDNFSCNSNYQPEAFIRGRTLIPRRMSPDGQASRYPPQSMHTSFSPGGVALWPSTLMQTVDSHPYSHHTMRQSGLLVNSTGFNTDGSCHEVMPSYDALNPSYSSCEQHLPNSEAHTFGRILSQTPIKQPSALLNPQKRLDSISPNDSSSSLLDIPTQRPPNTVRSTATPSALVRTILRVHGNGKLASLWPTSNHLRSSESPPPAVPARRYPHGPRRSTQSVCSRILRSPACLQPGMASTAEQYFANEQKKFKLEGHLDCSCNYVRADPGIWPANVWYQQNFHTVDRCTCPHEEVHRFFDNAASTWRLADTIAMLPIKETDILDDLVDSTSEEDESLEMALLKDKVLEVYGTTDIQSKEEMSKSGMVPQVNHLSSDEPNTVFRKELWRDQQKCKSIDKTATSNKTGPNSTQPHLSNEDDDLIPLGQLLSSSEMLQQSALGTVAAPKDQCVEGQITLTPVSTNKNAIDRQVTISSSDTPLSTKDYLSEVDAVTSESAFQIGNKKDDLSDTVEDTWMLSANKYCDLAEQSGQIAKSKPLPDRSGADSESDQNDDRFMPTKPDVLENGPISTHSEKTSVPVTIQEGQRDIQNPTGNSLIRLPLYELPQQRQSESPLSHTREIETENTREVESDLDLNEWLATSNDSSISEAVQSYQGTEKGMSDVEEGPQSANTSKYGDDIGSYIDRQNAAVEIAKVEDQVKNAFPPSLSDTTTKKTKSVRDQFTSRQRALKRWALLSAHVSDMANRRRKDKETAEALGFYTSIESAPEKHLWEKRGISMVSDL